MKTYRHNMREILILYLIISIFLFLYAFVSYGYWLFRPNYLFLAVIFLIANALWRHRSKIILDEKGITLQNPIRKKHIAWEEIKRLSFPRISSWGIPSLRIETGERPPFLTLKPRLWYTQVPSSSVSLVKDIIDSAKISKIDSRIEAYLRNPRRINPWIRLIFTIIVLVMLVFLIFVWWQIATYGTRDFKYVLFVFSTAYPALFFLTGGYAFFRRESQWKGLFMFTCGMVTLACVGWIFLSTMFFKPRETHLVILLTISILLSAIALLVSLPLRMSIRQWVSICIVLLVMAGGSLGWYLGTNGVELKLLKALPDNPFFPPTWSGDGQKILTVTSSDEETNLFIIDKEPGYGSEFVLPGSCYHYSFSPDNLSLVCEVLREKEEDQIWLIDITDGTKRILFSDFDISLNAEHCWSPDGKEFLFRVCKEVVKLYRMAIEDGYSTLIHSGPKIYRPFWLPNGEIGFFKAEEHGDKKKGYSLWTISPNGNNLKGAYKNEEPWFTYKLSPHLRYLLFSYEDPDEASSFWAIDLSTLERRRLDFRPPQCFYKVSWSSDEERILLVPKEEGEGNIWEIDLATEEGRKIYSTSEGEISRISWSPDGTQIAFLLEYRLVDILYILSLEDGKRYRVRRGTSIFDFPKFDYSMHENILAYTTGKPLFPGRHGTSELWVAKLKTF